MRVHLQGQWEAWAWPAELEVSTGEEPPAETEVWVHGVPDAERLDRLSELRAVVVPWAGVPERTAGLLRERPGVALFNLHHNAAATAEMAFALLLAVAKKIVPGDAGMRVGRWESHQPGWLAQGLEGRRALVLGYGAIGQRIGRMCQAAGMRVTGVRTRGSEPLEGVPVHGIGELAYLLPEADALLIALPLTPVTRGLIGARELALLPPDAILVNVGRAAIVEEEALFNALQSGALFGAGLDVWYRYPKADRQGWPAERPFWELPNLVMSPHHGGNVAGIEPQRMAALAALLAALARGEDAPGRVDPARGY